MLEAEIWSITQIDHGDAVLLRPLNSDRVVPIYIGETESHAILLSLEGIKAKRPFVYDTLLELSQRLGLCLVRVEIYKIKEDIFYARLLFSGGEYSGSRFLVVESRPSDAIALAIRAKCGIYVASQVLSWAGISSEMFVDEAGKTTLSGSGLAADDGAEKDAERGAVEKGVFHVKPRNGSARKSPGDNERRPAEAGSPLAVKRRRLQAELEQALEDEVYERAAEIRDLLILLDRQLEQERRKAP
ncbi:MAG: DUF151 domain-containing protein [Treponema sp.]|nr:DUF151 domain-containing protein [Treponema sp.]